MLAGPGGQVFGAGRRRVSAASTSMAGSVCSFGLAAEIDECFFVE